ncbi:aminotransferase class IV [Streptomyces sp. LX-29]|uniref:aminotransferase class IV n=1 Tax=Streptomyces sp. LX-29 TaxID=2900152 RepID=UPI00240D680C|nr:aminotransferase class IV [Streptomyces sp. LX-29]WFB10804.1 aminotransferase class IV [Streptomyces sp. LX-29]
MAELNGRPADADALRALGLTNYGHFTTMRVEDGRVRGLELHLERLARDCRTVFGVELDLERVRDYAHRAVAGRGGALVVRVTVFDPDLDLGRPAAPASPQVLVTHRPAAAWPLPPLRARTVPYVRDTPRVKHVGLFGALYARRTAQLAGFDDALFTGEGELVSEGGTWNAGFVDADGTVVWPDAEVLPGVTQALLQRAGDHRTAPITAAEARGMAAAFATNTAFGVRAVSGIDDASLPPDHPVLAALRARYLAHPGEPL